MNTFYKFLILFAWIIVLSGCTPQNTSSGRATVTGKFTDPVLGKQSNTYIITLSVPNLILGKTTDYQTTMKSDGSFNIDIPVVSPVYTEVSVGSEKYGGRILLSPRKTTRLDLFLDESSKLRLRKIENFDLKAEDLININNVSSKMLEAIQKGINSPKLTLSSTPTEYADSMLIRMEKDLTIVYEDSILSKEHKESYCNLLKQFYLNVSFLAYENNMRLLYINSNRQNGKEDNAEPFVPQNPDKSYYTFLKRFDLNNPPRLNDMYYSKNLQTILSKPELNIPRIGDTPIADWLKKVNAIVSKYKGKVVVVDFWATWCEPCMNAIEKMKTYVEDEFSNKNVVFVYISNISSPKGLWEKKILEIGHEHYYLNEEEWESMSYSKQYGFSGIPSYLLFNSTGKLKYKIFGYPGNIDMQEMMEELLQ